MKELKVRELPDRLKAMLEALPRGVADMCALGQSLGMALRDYRHEALFSACSVFVLAAVLTPLMVLLGVRNGVIGAMTERLLRDPRTLEIIPVGSGKYAPNWFKAISALPQTAFVVPQTRSIAATINLSNPKQPGMGRSVTQFIATGPGDPLLKRYGLPDAAFRSGSEANVYPTPLVILSASVARKLGIASADAGQNPGSGPEAGIASSLERAGEALLEGRVERRIQGRREAADINLRVAGILPPEALGADALFVPLELLAAAEDYRDGRAAPFFRPVAAPGAERRPGRNPSLANIQEYRRAVLEDREYASFRLYARSLDAVEPLWERLREQKIEVYVKSGDIEAVKNLDHAFGVIFGLITGAALFGFAASTAGNALAGVRRKSRSLGIMRLLGFPGTGILLFPLVQTLLTAFLGAVLASLLYLGVAISIDVF
ncbi:MAG: ABC transporter permease, partial [Desulfovibrio sp.]|nr:ABC transporter permease [Desulfovibrio sp.]